jgi:hypothetical protein
MIAPRGRRKIRWIEIIQAVNLTSPLPPRAKSSQRLWSWSRILIFRTWQVCSRCPSRIGPLSNLLGNMDLWGLYSLTDLDFPRDFGPLAYFIIFIASYCILNIVSKGLHEYADLRSADGGVLNLRKVEFAECWIGSDTGPASVRPAMSSATSNSANRAIFALSSSTRSQASRKRQRTVDQPSKIIYKLRYL